MAIRKDKCTCWRAAEGWSNAPWVKASKRQGGGESLCFHEQCCIPSATERTPLSARKARTSASRRRRRRRRSSIVPESRYTLVFPPLGRLFQPFSTRYRLLYYRNFQINSPNGIHGSTLSRNPPIFVVPSARLIASAFRGLINLQYWLSNHRFSSSAIFTVYIPSFDW